MSSKSGPPPIRQERTLGDILGDALSANAHPEPVIVSAALGDTDAQRDLANSSFNDAERLTGLAALLSCMEALTFARLAAAGGESRPDSLSAVFLWGEVSRRCMDMGEPDLAVHFEANGLLMAEAMAEAGDEEVATMVIQSSPRVSPAAHSEARRLREMWAAA